MREKSGADLGRRVTEIEVKSKQGEVSRSGRKGPTEGPFHYRSREI
jgi:hypothetical protein